MNIVQISLAMGYGGAEVHTLTLMRGLINAGAQATLVCQPGSWLAKQASAWHLPFRCIRFHGNYDLLAVCRLRLLLNRMRPDIVHAQLTRASRYAGWASVGSHWVFLATCHATSSHTNMGRCRKIIAVSEAVRRQLVRYYPAEQVERVYIGIDAPANADRAEVRARIGIGADEFALACVGRFVPEKGQDLAVEAMKTLPGNFRLYFIGDQNTDYGRRIVKMAGGMPRVIFLGYQEHVTEILKGMDLVVAPSRREALSLAAVEAQVVGLPVVASRVGGLPEVVEDGVSGLLVPPDDVAALGAAVLKIAASAELRTRFSAAAKESYARNFRSEDMTQAILKIYRRLLPNPQRQTVRPAYF
jgi:glycosyltransferase involved in cell wall biosynthesis